jgi:hypothetical protein
LVAAMQQLTLALNGEQSSFMLCPPLISHASDGPHAHEQFVGNGSAQHFSNSGPACHSSDPDS